MMSKITTVIFDLDNTLIDRQKAAREIIKDIIDMDFPNASIEEKQDIFLKLYEFDAEGHVLKEECFKKYIEYFQIKHKTWEEYYDYWNKNFAKNTYVFPKSDEVLKYIKSKYRIAMITNGNVDMQREKLKRSTIQYHFDTIMISGEFGIPKPDARIFLEMCRRLNVKPEECVYVGDSLKHDVSGSIGAGMHSIWIHPNPEYRTDLPCQRIYHIEDLMLVL